MSRRPTKITKALLRATPLPDLPGESDKEARGRVLVVAGSRQTPGAALLTATAALRSGAGKLAIAAGRSYALAVAVAIPEALVTGLDETAGGEIAGDAAPAVLKAAKEADAVVLGPGMTGSAAGTILRRLGATAKMQMVVDAGALHDILAQKKALSGSAGRLVLTPHAGEMAGMTGWSKDRVQGAPEQAALMVAKALGAVVVLKGETTVIAASDGQLWVHTGGVVGLGTSGSGDVLAGIIGGLLARGATPAEAAIWGVFAHGKAGARLTKSVGPLGFLAREILAEIPSVLACVGQKEVQAKRRRSAK